MRREISLRIYKGRGQSLQKSTPRTVLMLGKVYFTLIPSQNMDCFVKILHVSHLLPLPPSGTLASGCPSLRTPLTIIMHIIGLTWNLSRFDCPSLYLYSIFSLCSFSLNQSYQQGSNGGMFRPRDSF